MRGKNRPSLWPAGTGRSPSPGRRSSQSLPLVSLVFNLSQPNPAPEFECGYHNKWAAILHILRPVTRRPPVWDPCIPDVGERAVPPWHQRMYWLMAAVCALIAVPVILSNPGLWRSQPQRGHRTRGHTVIANHGRPTRHAGCCRCFLDHRAGSGDASRRCERGFRSWQAKHGG